MWGQMFYSVQRKKVLSERENMNAQMEYKLYRTFH